MLKANLYLLAWKNGETLLTRRIEEDGVVNLVVSREGEDIIRKVGQLKIANFQSPQYLRRLVMVSILMVKSVKMLLEF